MKKIAILFTSAFILLAVTSSAQNGNAERYWQMLKDSLQLTDGKIDSVMAVREQFQPQMRDIYMDQSGNADDKKNRLHEINMQMKTKLKPFLNDAEIEKLEAMQQRMRDRMRNRNDN